jgi:serine/threonine protein phosphatase PrpC
VHFFGICDGHGSNGKLVSSFIKNEFPKTFGQHLELLYESNGFTKDPTSQEIKQALEMAFEEINERLYGCPFDIRFSGSTWVVCIFIKNRCFVANVGDSRAVLVKRKAGQVVCYPLSDDHKPTLEHEQERIEENGGRVEPYQDQHGRFKGPARVWFKDQDIPGLAMSRSMADSCAAEVGVIAIP